MLWFYLALLTAIFWAFEHIISKKLTNKANSDYIAFTSTLLSSIISIFLIIIFYDNLALNKNFLLILVPVGLVSASARLMTLKSLKISEVSRTIPLLSLSPIFTLIFAFVLLSESPPFISIFGIVLAIIGVYVLQMKSFSLTNLFNPFIDLLRNKGTLLMLVVSILYGLGGVLDKSAVNSSNVLTYLFLVNPLSLIFQGIYLFSKNKGNVVIETSKIIKTNYKHLILLTFVGLITITFQFWAVSLTYSSYVIAVKRTSALFAIIMGYFILKERADFKKSIIGTAIILAGVYFILLN